MYIDTHAHLDMPEFKGEIGAVIGRANAANVKKIINIGVNLESSKASGDLARKYPEVYGTIGIHPDASEELDLTTRTAMMTLSANRKIVAVGEIGLDYYYVKRSSRFAHYPKREGQIFCFEQMLDLAIELHLPVVVHCREAESDVYSILKSYSGSLRGVVHCFSGDYDFAKKILDMGFLLSFTGNITYKNSSLASVINKIPLGSIMIETDSPFLTPEPGRGKRNEPANVVEVAKKIAEIKNIPLADVESSTTKKADSFFRLN